MVIDKLRPGKINMSAGFSSLSSQLDCIREISMSTRGVVLHRRVLAGKGWGTDVRCAPLSHPLTDQVVSAMMANMRREARETAVRLSSASCCQFLPYRYTSDTWNEGSPWFELTSFYYIGL